MKTFLTCLVVAISLFATRADAQPAAAATPPVAAAAAAPAAAPAAAAPATAPAAAAPAAAKAPVEKQWYEKLEDAPMAPNSNYWMPVDASTAAAGSDQMFYVCLGLSAFFFFSITGIVIYFVIKYRHRPGHKAQPSAAHNDTLEITWTVIPTIICVFLFLYGWRNYLALTTPPQRAVEIQVLAQKWNWTFTQPNGYQDANLHVPVNTPVRLVMTAKDVLHSFYVPAFRIKQDVVPRRYTYAWFEATKPGTYRLDCAEYCGTDHSQMKRVIVVHKPGEYEKYLADADANSANKPPAELGASLYVKKGCNSCHTTDGTPRVGPSWKGQFGLTITLNDGSKQLVDENYIRRSILDPQAQSRPGYPPSMPSFEGQLKEKEIAGLIAYYKSLTP